MDAATTKEVSKVTPPTFKLPLSPKKAERLISKEMQAPKHCCEASGCITNGSKDVLKCDSCEKLVHYFCTDLPCYQISMFLSRAYSKFRCINCVKIPRAISKLSKTQQTANQTAKQSDYNKWMEKCATLEKEIEEKGKHIHVLTNGLNAGSDQIKLLQREVAACENLIKKDDEEMKKLQEKIDDLEAGLQNEKDTSKYDVMTNLATLNANIMNQLADISVTIKKIESTSRFRNDDDTNKSYATALKSDGNTQNRVTRNGSFDEAQFAKLSDEHDRRRRSLNLIIHGHREMANDETVVREILRSIHQPAPEFKWIRIGRKEQKKARPIKVIFKKEGDRKKIMENLFKLKGNEEYAGISITHDYSIMERKLIKQWVDRAKDLSSKNKKCTFKVWGNIYDGLFFKRFWKKKEENENQRT